MRCPLCVASPEPIWAPSGEQALDRPQESKLSTGPESTLSTGRIADLQPVPEGEQALPCKALAGPDHPLPSGVLRYTSW